MSVSGKPGLFRLITQAKAGFVVESITDKKRTMVDAQQRVSMLKDITIYTKGDDKPLRQVLKTMREKDGTSLPVNPKSEATELKNYFKTVVPDYDEERVYLSDIKKIIGWYGLLDGFSFDEEATKKESEENASTAASPSDATPEQAATDSPDRPPVL